MRYNNQLLFDKGLSSLAYQLEAMADKAPEIADDFENLGTAILSLVEATEEKLADTFEQGREQGYEEGYEDGYYGGYSEGEMDAEMYLEDDYAEGYEVGYGNGYAEGFEAGQENNE